MELFHDAIRKIKYAEPKFNSSTIEHWVSTGKVTGSEAQWYENVR